MLVLVLVLALMPIVMLVMMLMLMLMLMLVHMLMLVLMLMRCLLSTNERLFPCTARCRFPSIHNYNRPDSPSEQQ